MSRPALRFVPAGPTPPMALPDPEVVALVRAAVSGDGQAVASLVTRFDRSLRAIARSYRLSPWDVDDVAQSTWIQFVEHGSSLRDPAAVSGWLRTTTRRHCLRVLQAHVRERLSEDPAEAHVGHDGQHDAELVARETRAALNASLRRLSARQRDLITLLFDEPDLSYAEVGRRLGLPVGSIGPTRARALSRLRQCDQLQAVR